MGCFWIVLYCINVVSNLFIWLYRDDMRTCPKIVGVIIRAGVRRLAAPSRVEPGVPGGRRLLVQLHLAVPEGPAPRALRRPRDILEEWITDPEDVKNDRGMRAWT